MNSDLSIHQMQRAFWAPGPFDEKVVCHRVRRFILSLFHDFHYSIIDFVQSRYFPRRISVRDFGALVVFSNANSVIQTPRKNVKKSNCEQEIKAKWMQIHKSFFLRVVCQFHFCDQNIAIVLSTAVIEWMCFLSCFPIIINLHHLDKLV